MLLEKSRVAQNTLKQQVQSILIRMAADDAAKQRERNIVCLLSVKRAGKNQNAN